MYTEIRVHIRREDTAIVGTRSRGEAVITVAGAAGTCVIYFDGLADIEKFSEAITKYINERKAVNHAAGNAQ